MQFASHNADADAAPLKLGETPTNLSGGKARWKYPREWITPLKWYWGTVGWYDEPSNVDTAGASWVEMVTDFEVATRVTMGGSWLSSKNTQGKSEEGKGASSVKPGGYTSITTLFPHAGRSVAVLPRKPKLVNPLGVQTLTYSRALEPGAPAKDHWTRLPRYTGIPPPVWAGGPSGLMS